MPWHMTAGQSSQLRTIPGPRHSTPTTSLSVYRTEVVSRVRAGAEPLLDICGVVGVTSALVAHGTVRVRAGCRHS